MLFFGIVFVLSEAKFLEKYIVYCKLLSFPVDGQFLSPTYVVRITFRLWNRKDEVANILMLSSIFSQYINKGNSGNTADQNV